MARRQADPEVGVVYDLVTVDPNERGRGRRSVRGAAIHRDAAGVVVRRRRSGRVATLNVVIVDPNRRHTRTARTVYVDDVADGTYVRLMNDLIPSYFDAGKILQVGENSKVVAVVLPELQV